jgi:hypothetical protein
VQEALVQQLTASCGGVKVTKQAQQRLSYVLALWCVVPAVAWCACPDGSPDPSLTRIVPCDALPRYNRQEATGCDLAAPGAEPAGDFALPPSSANLLEEPGAACARLFDGFQMSSAKRRRVAEPEPEEALPGGLEGDAASTWTPVRVLQVDEHHHVLQADVFKTALQDQAGLVLVNFDSHDDLGVPPPSPGLGSQEAGTLQGASDVGTWIVPLLAHRAVRTVVWVTAWANIPRKKFNAHVVRFPCGKLAIGGAGVPKIWRSLWGDDFTTDPAPASGKPGGPVVHPFRVVVVDVEGAASALKDELRLLYNGRKPLGSSTSCVLSVDIDYFSTRNPALRSLPFSDHPSFAKAIWRLARTVPIMEGDAFHAALTRLVVPGEDPHEVAAAIAACAVGTDYEDPLPRHELLSTVHAAVERFKKLSRGQRQDAYGALLRAHLADHQATPAELKQLMESFQAAVTVMMAQPGASREVVLARSEMYTTKRQAQDILHNALDILQVLP